MSKSIQSTRLVIVYCISARRALSSIFSAATINELRQSAVSGPQLQTPMEQHPFLPMNGRDWANKTCLDLIIATDLALTTSEEVAHY